MAELTPMQKSLAARQLLATRPHLAAVALIAHPDYLWRLCRDELSGVDLQVDGWDIRARWFGVVIVATPGRGQLDRGVTLEWRDVARHLRPAR
jgi:hypothetical protein